MWTKLRWHAIPTVADRQTDLPALLSQPHRDVAATVHKRVVHERGQDLEDMLASRPSSHLAVKVEHEGPPLGFEARHADLAELDEPELV